jgi:hypothetical protein
MSSYAERLASELRNAYEAHDRDAFDRATRRMVQTMHYTGPVEDRQRAVSDCAKGKGCTCGRTIQRETCMERTGGASAQPAREPVHEAPQHPVNNTTFAGSVHCTRPECECTSWPQAKTCMHRRTA